MDFDGNINTCQFDSGVGYNQKIDKIWAQVEENFKNFTRKNT